MKAGIWTRGCLLTGALVLALGVAHAEGTGDSFDDDIEGWTFSSDLEATWNSRDAMGSTTSGSMRVRNVASTDNGGFPSVVRCFDVAGGISTTFEAAVLISNAEPAPAEVAMIVHFYSGAQCNEGRLGSLFSNTLDGPREQWHTLSTQGVSPSSARTVEVFLGLRKPGGGAAVAEVFWDDVVITAAQGNCRAEFDSLCLVGEQFEVTVRYQDFSGNQGDGQALPLSGDSGLFWFFDADNPELLVKVVDGCGFNDRFWVFAAGTTNVSYELEVVHLESGERRLYRNPLGVASDAVTDTNAFALCDLGGV